VPVRQDGARRFIFRNEIVAACGIKPGMAVADVGCGTGIFTGCFHRRGPRARCLPSTLPRNFRAAHRGDGGQGAAANVVGVFCAADDVRLPPESIDLGSSADVYHHFEFPLRTMRSIHRP